MIQSSAMDLAPRPIYSGWREVPMPDDQLVDLCHVVRGVVDACVENPRMRIDSSIALRGVPHNNRFVPPAIREAVGQTRFSSMNVVINGASSIGGLISVEALDLDNPARRVRFTELNGMDQFLLTDTHDTMSRARGRAVAMAVGADAVAYWLAGQLTGNGEQAEALVEDYDGREAIDHAARLLENRAEIKHAVSVSGAPVSPGVLLHTQLATSNRLQGPEASDRPFLRQYCAWLTAFHEDPDHLPPGVARIDQTAMVCFTPEYGVLEHPGSKTGNDNSATSVRIGLEAFGEADADTAWLAAAALNTAGDDMFGHFQHVSRLLGANIN